MKICLCLLFIIWLLLFKIQNLQQLFEYYNLCQPTIIDNFVTLDYKQVVQWDAKLLAKYSLTLLTRPEKWSLSFKDLLMCRSKLIHFVVLFFFCCCCCLSQVMGLLLFHFHSNHSWVVIYLPQQSLTWGPYLWHYTSISASKGLAGDLFVGLSSSMWIMSMTNELIVFSLWLFRWKVGLVFRHYHSAIPVCSGWVREEETGGGRRRTTSKRREGGGDEIYSNNERKVKVCSVY